jgi:hypothetical protein
MGLVRDTLAALREVVIVGLFLFLLTNPVKFGELMTKAGVTKVSYPGVLEWQPPLKQTKDVGQSIAQVQGKLEDLSASLQQDVKDQPGDQVSKSKIATLSDEIQKLLKETKLADEAVKTSLLAQQQFVPAAAQETQGWMYLGKATGNHAQWTGGTPETVEKIELADLKPGTTLRVRGAVYLRGGTTDPNPEGAVLSVLQPKAQVEVVDVAYPARKWGTAVWAKVKRA